MTKVRRRRTVGWSSGPLSLVLLAPTAAAAEGAPDFSVIVRETGEVWRNLEGGVAVGDTSLNKLQVAATWTANQLNDPGLRLHVQVFRTNGERLTSRVGDLQTVSNIEALSVTRLFEAFAEQSFGQPGAGGVILRAGLIDLNSDFDSIEPAGLFIDSSHGIGPDISKSGRNGPSIFPASSAAVRLTWTPTPAWTLHAGVFDGVPGDPDHPKAFATVTLSRSDGALGIVQVDRKLGAAQVSLGAWRYSTPLPRLDGAGRSHQGGVYGFIEGPAPGLPGWSGWLRLGRADGDAQVVSGYAGAGLVKTGVGRRTDDQFGVAVSHAVIGEPAQRLLGLRHDETTWEATYQLKVTDWLALQPDVQYVVRPSSVAGLPNALAIGLRVAVSAGYPPKAPAPPAVDASGPDGR